MYTENRKGESRNQLIKSITLFMTSIVIIAYFFPRETQFRYIFQEGKPWKYELLTAPFDFPIYKSEENVASEKDSILRNFQPYFSYDEKIQEREIKHLKEDYANLYINKIPQSYFIFIERELSIIYKRGVINIHETDSLKNANVNFLRAPENGIYRNLSIDNIYTAATAYEAIINNAPSYLSKEILKTCNINNYIHENLIYDKATTDKLLQNKINGISLANGLIQAGERIIDKGEIINSQTYNILNSLKIKMENQEGSKSRLYFVFIGQFFIITIMLLSLYFYLILFRRGLFRNTRDVSFILLTSVVLIILTCIAVSTQLLTVFLIPYAILPIVLCTFFDSRTALFTHLITVMIASFITPFPFEFLILQIATGMTVIFSLRELTQRSQLVTCAIYVFLTYALFYTCILFVQEGDWTRLNPRTYGFLFLNSAFLTFAYLLIYIFERTFGYISTVTLIELQNINNPALRNLSEECPGTFQHSLQVGTLAYEAARCINANSQLVRTGAFYHDIGKMKNPVFFTENQNGVNPHDKLTYEESAEIIISHVNEGVKLAEKYNLPKPVIEFIKTHHGKNKVKYFYNSFKNKYPNRVIDESAFSYPGPLPFSKETALLMMADAVEATSRSLKEYNDETISNLVEQTIDTQISEGALKNAPITFKDVERVKAVFKDRLRIIFHTRISYPELKDKRNN